MTVSDGQDNIKYDAIKNVLLAQNEDELTKILKENMSKTGSADALHDKTWNLGLFKITLHDSKKDEHHDDPNKKKVKSHACSIQ